MKVVITGAGGFLGSRLVTRLLRDGTLAGRQVERIVALDVAVPDLPADPRVEAVAGDVAERAVIEPLLAGVDVVYHLAAVVSAAAEADFDLGMRVNLDGTRTLLDSLRRLGQVPRLVFASSVAVYGGPLPDPVRDDTHLTPQTSYGTQKAVGELLVADYARKGFVDGLSLRLPTIVVRPGRPNRAASAFASSIVREPLTGREAVCPVPEDTAIYVLSPRRVIDAFVRAAALPASDLPAGRAFVLPGITVTVREMLEALRRVGGEPAVRRVRFEPDPAITRIVRSWPARFEARIARDLGFAADSGFEEIVRAFVEDELGGRIAGE